MRYNILYLNHYSWVYGSENSLLELVTHLNQDMFHPSVVLPDDGPLSQKLRVAGIETIPTPLHPLKAHSPIPYLRTVWRLMNIIRQERIDLVHANCDLSGQYGIVAGRLAGIPTVCSTRNLLGPRAYRRSFLGWADALVANSKAVAATWLPHRTQKRYILYNAVDLAKFTSIGCRARLRHQWGLDEQTFVVAVIGRITQNKGQETFLKALKQVVVQAPRTHAFLVGSTEIDQSGDFLLMLKQIVRTLGLLEKVTFVDAVESVPAFLEMIDLLVCPSVAEPFGRILIEAMAMEKPVIANAVGGPLEIVGEGETGFLVPPNDPVELAEAILKILLDKELGKKMGENGREQVKRFFAIEENVRKTEEVYLHLLQNQDK